jgi:hypothetical protein
MRDEVDRDLPPNVKWYLEQREKKDWFLQSGPFAERTRMPDSQGLRLVGKWGRGPANKVTGRDSLVFMSLGSEVAIFNAADGSNPRVIAEIQCRNMTGRVYLKDSFLFVGSQGPVEVYSIADPARPRFLCYAPVVGAELSIQDSLAYVLGIDSLFIYNVSNPANWQRVGATRDSGYSLNVADGFAYLADRWGLYVIDCTNPANPHRAGTLSGGVQVSTSWTENDYCYYTETYPSAAFVVASVADPYHPSELGRRTGIGGGDIYKIDFFVYLPGFQILDVSQPSSPTVICSLAVVGYLNGVWTRSPYSHGFVAAGYQGLTAININDPVHPFVDTTMAGAYSSIDVCVDSSFAYIANDLSGMKIVDLHVPSSPTEVGSYDSTGYAPIADAVRARDSLAYLTTHVWLPTGFRVIDVADPRNPTLSATARLFNPGRAMVVRDSLAYVAEDYKFEIFSIAQPRNPRLVGSCGLQDASYGMAVRDSFAYIANGNYFVVLSVANPASPRVVGSLRPPRGALDVAIMDTIAYVVCGDVYTVSIANPEAPYLVATCTIPQNARCIAVNGNTAFVGECPYTSMLRVFDISDPTALAQVGYYTMPDHVWRVVCESPYVYAACLGAGVCILETTSTSGVADESSIREAADGRLRVTALPNLVHDEIGLRIDSRETRAVIVKVTDVSGRKLIEARLPVAAGKARLVLPTGKMPPGVYFVTARCDNGETTTKVVRQ